jgi:hypothetical protein
MKTIEEKENLIDILKSCQQTLEDLVSKEKAPINKMVTEE